MHAESLTLSETLPHSPQRALSGFDFVERCDSFALRVLQHAAHWEVCVLCDGNLDNKGLILNFSGSPMPL